MITSPILAASLLPPEVEHTDDIVFEAMKKLKYPVIASLKKDGIRALRGDNLYSRTLHLIPNLQIRTRSNILPYGFDMELWNPELEYNDIQSIVMSEEHKDSDLIQFHLLDDFDLSTLYAQRLEYLQMWTMKNKCPSIIFEVPVLCHWPIELFEYEKYCIQSLGEGICFRLPDSPYKQGRSTLKEQYLVKLSRYTRSEVMIIGFQEAKMNLNREKRNPVGLIKRSTFKAGMMPKDTLGSFIVMDDMRRNFSVGCGVLNHKQRQLIWDEKEKYMNKVITIKHKLCGEKILPRSPSFVGLREGGF